MLKMVERLAFVTKSGRTLLIEPGTEVPVPVDEMIRRRDEWLERNKEILNGYSVDDFIAEKRRDVEKGLL